MNLSFGEMWTHMGWPALIVAVSLLVMGLASLTVFIERIMTLRRSREQSRKFAVETGGHLRAEKIDQVIDDRGCHDVMRGLLERCSESQHLVRTFPRRRFNGH